MINSGTSVFSSSGLCNTQIFLYSWILKPQTKTAPRHAFVVRLESLSLYFIARLFSTLRFNNFMVCSCSLCAIRSRFHLSTRRSLARTLIVDKYAAFDRNNYRDESAWNRGNSSPWDQLRSDHFDSRHPNRRPSSVCLCVCTCGRFEAINFGCYVFSYRKFSLFANISEFVKRCFQRGFAIRGNRVPRRHSDRRDRANREFTLPFVNATSLKTSVVETRGKPTRRHVRRARDRSLFTGPNYKTIKSIFTDGQILSCSRSRCLVGLIIHVIFLQHRHSPIHALSLSHSLSFSRFSLITRSPYKYNIYVYIYVCSVPF